MLHVLRAFIADPVVMRKVNGYLTIAWFVAALPICLFLSNSVPFLVFVSVYAVVTGHLSTWQAARVEVRQDEQDIGAEVTEALVRNTTLEETSD